MSEITNPQITKSEEYKALRHFGNYIDTAVQTLHISPDRMNHLQNVSNEINEILNVFVYAEHINYEHPYTDYFLGQYDIFNQMIKEIHDGTILKFNGKSLNIWSSDYSKRYTTGNSTEFSKKINSFRNRAFKSKIKDYMTLLKKEKV